MILFKSNKKIDWKRRTLNTHDVYKSAAQKELEITSNDNLIMSNDRETAFFTTC